MLTAAAVDGEVCRGLRAGSVEVAAEQDVALAAMRISVTRMHLVYRTLTTDSRILESVKSDEFSPNTSKIG